MSEHPMTDTEKRELMLWLAETVKGWHIMSNLRTAYCDADGAFVHWVETWNPLESITDAHELEGCLPEHKRRIYLLRLRDFITDLEIVGMTKLYWGFRRVTPLQICLAIRKVWEE